MSDSSPSAQRLETWLSRASQGTVALLDLAVVAALAGSASALFLWALDAVTVWRVSNPWWLAGLPLAGAGVAWLYQRWGGAAASGNGGVVAALQNEGEGVPRRMAPLILFTTLLTHLGGGSAGREGTAVQMGASLATWWRGARVWTPERVQRAVRAGVAAGFGSVFGTPWAGALFAVEVPVVGRPAWRELAGTVVAGWLGHGVCLAWGAYHTSYPVKWSAWQAVPAWGWAVVLGAGLAFGLVARAYVTLEHGLRLVLGRWLPSPVWRAAVGGLGLLGLAGALGHGDYLGLGVDPSRPGGAALTACFVVGGVSLLSWAWKLVFTALTLASGYRGGEVTPLFFVGAAAGYSAATLTGLPVDVFAALGFAAVFGAAARTPLACVVLGMETFGGEGTLLFAVSGLAAFLVVGPRGLYASQRFTPRWAAWFGSDRMG